MLLMVLGFADLPAQTPANANRMPPPKGAATPKPERKPLVAVRGPVLRRFT